MTKNDHQCCHMWITSFPVLRITVFILSWRPRRRSQRKIGCCRHWTTWRFCPGKIKNLFWLGSDSFFSQPLPATLAGPDVSKSTSVSLAALAANWCNVDVLDCQGTDRDVGPLPDAKAASARRGCAGISVTTYFNIIVVWINCSFCSFL